MPSGILAFTILSFFIGTASYTNTFVAQYNGAGRPKRVGASLWQAIYFSLAAGLLLPLLAPFSAQIFKAVGHEPALQDLEIRYFRIMVIGSIFAVYSTAISCFYTGRGRTWPLMWVNFAITLINVVLDYLMIFGHAGLPEMGIEGAAWATIIAQAAGAVIFSVLVFSKGNQDHFATRSAWKLDRPLFLRLLRFGAPSGVQFLIDVLAFAIFVMIIGRIGAEELAATTLAFQINTLAFMPMLGFGIAASTMVGEKLGGNRPDLAERATWSSFQLTLCYAVFIALFYAIKPNWFIDPFTAKAHDVAQFAEIRKMAVIVLYFIAFYCVFDTMNIIMVSALKGAGDTRFAMLTSVCLGWLIMVLPTWIFCGPGKRGIYTAWFFVTLYVTVLGIVFLVRFKKGKWRTIRVIEMPHQGAIAVSLPESPTADTDL